MHRICGLKEYVQRQEYKKALDIPEKAVVEYQMLGQGEYNINYVFTHPVTGVKLVLRVNTGSQMQLHDQIGYEYNALKLLKESGRTPKPLYVDGSRSYLEYGILVMEYLDGVALDYRKDMQEAAAILADIHSTQISAGAGLLAPDEPLKAILEECLQMFETYLSSPLGDESTKKQIQRMLARGQEMLRDQQTYDGYRCCINTELNSGNFLIDNKNPGKGRLIDWEKPLYGDPAQDLGHFLAPTTTYWKTDVFLTKKEMDRFIQDYRIAVRGRFDLGGMEERLKLFIPITCLRGITWCAMAWVEYQQPDRVICNQYTFAKMEEYLSRNFLDNIENQYFQSSGFKP